MDERGILMQLNKKTINMLMKTRIETEFKKYAIEKNLTNDDIEKLRSIICDELINRGLGPDDNVNDYGVFLEDLIDDLGHYIE